jgi:hypothetical protein
MGDCMCEDLAGDGVGKEGEVRENRIYAIYGYLYIVCLYGKVIKKPIKKFQERFKIGGWKEGF